MVPNPRWTSTWPGMVRLPQVMLRTKEHRAYEPTVYGISFPKGRGTFWTGQPERAPREDPAVRAKSFFQVRPAGELHQFGVQFQQDRLPVERQAVKLRRLGELDARLAFRRVRGTQAQRQRARPEFDRAQIVALLRRRPVCNAHVMNRGLDGGDGVFSFEDPLGLCPSSGVGENVRQLCRKAWGEHLGFRFPPDHGQTALPSDRVNHGLFYVANLRKEDLSGDRVTMEHETPWKIIGRFACHSFLPRSFRGPTHGTIWEMISQSASRDSCHAAASCRVSHGAPFRSGSAMTSNGYIVRWSGGKDMAASYRPGCNLFAGTRSK